MILATLAIDRRCYLLLLLSYTSLHYCSFFLIVVAFAFRCWCRCCQDYRNGAEGY